MAIQNSKSSSILKSSFNINESVEETRLDFLVRSAGFCLDIEKSEWEIDLFSLMTTTEKFVRISRVLLRGSNNKIHKIHKLNNNFLVFHNCYNWTDRCWCLWIRGNSQWLNLNIPDDRHDLKWSDFCTYYDQGRIKVRRFKEPVLSVIKIFPWAVFLQSRLFSSLSRRVHFWWGEVVCVWEFCLDERRTKPKMVIKKKRVIATNTSFWEKNICVSNFNGAEKLTKNWTKTKVLNFMFQIEQLQVLLFTQKWVTSTSDTIHFVSSSCHPHMNNFDNPHHFSVCLLGFTFWGPKYWHKI